jgi:putative transposase
MHPERKILPHGIPSWVPDGSEYFITICAHPRGINQLCLPQPSKLIKDSLRFRQDRGDLWIHLLLLMPDHLHAVVSFSAAAGMKKTISDWKRYTCLHGGISWQRDFFEYRIRKDESFVEKASYIRMNPVRARLIDAPEKWPYAWPPW